MEQGSAIRCQLQQVQLRDSLGTPSFPPHPSPEHPRGVPSSLFCCPPLPTRSFPPAALQCLALSSVPGIQAGIVHSPSSKLNPRSFLIHTLVSRTHSVPDTQTYSHTHSTSKEPLQGSAYEQLMTLFIREQLCLCLPGDPFLTSLGEHSPVVAAGSLTSMGELESALGSSNS